MNNSSYNNDRQAIISTLPAYTKQSQKLIIYIYMMYVCVFGRIGDQSAQQQLDESWSTKKHELAIHLYISLQGIYWFLGSTERTFRSLEGLGR